ncbi:hypothetical protein RR46_02441 [Papilio xuthus]|uniref:BPTI/Kunitz inhibitor domain-containing protein n=1 Tax=Papilio xuthus TaxID=66420 RepID=A0A194QH50_PAPXU|nr:hypothetical protein RR46_02441 [Papilio xuthus]
MSPVPVLYYWKPGSRCEVGFWRGCLPNMNMFHDEYECVATCIFSARAGDVDYHNLNAIVESEESIEESTIPYDDNSTLSDTNSTTTDGTNTGNTGAGTGTGGTDTPAQTATT